MNIRLIVQAIGTLFPVIFPKQEFKPKRLVGVIICLALAVGSVKLLGVEATNDAIEAGKEILDMTEE